MQKYIVVNNHMDDGVRVMHIKRVPVGRKHQEYMKIIIKGSKYYLPIVRLESGDRAAHVAFKRAGDAINFATLSEQVSMNRMFSMRQPTYEQGKRIVSGKMG